MESKCYSRTWNHTLEANYDATVRLLAVFFSTIISFMIYIEISDLTWLKTFYPAWNLA